MGFTTCTLEMVKLRPTEGKILPPKVTQQTGVRAKIRSLVFGLPVQCALPNTNYEGLILFTYIISSDLQIREVLTSLFKR